MDTALRAAWRFFLEHAGYATPPGRAACALELARAERWAGEQGVTFAWQHDPEPWDADAPAPDEVLCCTASYGDESVALCGIGDPSDEYRRVIQAELSRELQTTFAAVVREYIDLLR